MSSESTPVLSRTISNFEILVTRWKILRAQHKVLKLWTEVGLDWAKKYYVQMDDTDAYVIVMCKFYTQYGTTLTANLKPTVLNPAVRFSWIEREWEEQYIQMSKKIALDLVSTLSFIVDYNLSQIYLVQMHQYHCRDPSLPSIEVPKSPARPVQCSGHQAPPTRFQVNFSTYESGPSLQESTVEAEYRKYVSGSLSSYKTDILKFWEVRFMLLDGAMAHILIGQQNRVPDTLCNHHGLSPNPSHICAL